jgi:hypothetical protein
LKKLNNKRSLVLIALLVAMATAVASQVMIGKRSERSTASQSVSSKYFDARVLLRDLEYLASDELEGRSAGLPSMSKAREFVEKRFKESGLQPLDGSFKQEFPIARRGSDPLVGLNFVGRVKGKKPAGKNIIITAHYDHVGIQNGLIFNGADDNASGTAALFAIAKYFSAKRTDHNLIFVAFDAEERGLQGARHFVADLPVAKGSILLNVNIDMIGRSDNGELYAAGTYHYPQFKPILEALQKKAAVTLLLGHDTPGSGGRNDWTFQSDHGAFHREKIPFIYFGVEDHEDYHKPTDDFAKIQPEFYAKAVETIIDSIRRLDKGINK